MSQNSDDEKKGIRTKVRLALSKFQAEVIYHALGATQNYEDHESDFGVDECEAAEDFLAKLTSPTIQYPETIHSARSAVVPENLIGAVIYVLDDILDRSTYLENEEMYAEDHWVSLGLARSILDRTKVSIENKIEKLREYE